MKSPIKTARRCLATARQIHRTLRGESLFAAYLRLLDQASKQNRHRAVWRQHTLIQVVALRRDVERGPGMGYQWYHDAGKLEGLEEALRRFDEGEG